MNGMHPLAFLFDTGLDEWALLGAIAFLLFGPKRLPEIARTIGRTLEKLRRAAADFREQVAHLDDPVAGGRSAEPGVRSVEPGTRTAQTGVRNAEDGAQASASRVPGPPPSTLHPQP